MINAPNMRHLTLMLDVDNHHCDLTSLFQLLTLSPRIETLRINLELEDGAEETFDNLIFQITLLTPCVVTLEITFMSTPGIPVFDRLFMMLSCHNYGILAPVLPKLRYLTLNVEHSADDKPRAPPITYSAGMLLRMLKLRYSPNRKSPDDPPATAILQSCTLSDARYEENLIWWVTTRDEEIKRRLEALHAHGFELGVMFCRRGGVIGQ
ncbi:hypothetical protein BJ138DRAFT_1117799 [Hygrophoropsis aurantiaca]|uniref:Uncharacterized protein n=1 Tax=Hygrophoropsis aurantiaca TaxID=72124 RepID=A0ACB7ZYK4_9AGAM|nr:hypothetical protein BJ138DRAFT_1117799 [Hygrophoropsis aurantiaca]